MNLRTAKKHANPLGGFTIMEVGVAAAVLAFTLVGMITTIESGAKMLDLSRRQTAAAQILRSQMEQLRVQDWTSTIQKYHASDVITASIDSGFNAGTHGYTLVRTTTPVNGNSGLLQITYTVSWTGITGTSYSRSSTTYVSQNGLSLAYQKS